MKVSRAISRIWMNLVVTMQVNNNRNNCIFFGSGL